LRGQGKRLPGGALLVPSPEDVRPTRPLESRQTRAGWVLSPPVPWIYVASSAAGILAAVVLVVSLLRRREVEPVPAPEPTLNG
jgi:hypothetical protein